MKILVVSPVFWPEAFRVNDLVAALVEAGHEVEVLAGMPNYPEGRFYHGYGWRGPMEEQHEGARILRFPVCPRGKGRALELMIHYATWVIGACLRLLTVSKKDWNVVFVCQTSPVSAALPGLLARRLSGARAAIWVQDLWPEIVQATGIVTHPWALKAIGWFSNRIYRSFDRVIAQSEGFRTALGERGIAAERLTCIHNWAEELYGVKPVTRLRVSTESWRGGFVLMFAGNLGRVQGLPTLLDAAERLKSHPRIHWVFLGDGALADWMREEIARRTLESSVWMLGRYPAEKMPEFFAGADALLLSLGRSSALSLTIPTKLQSYLAAGKPILGSIDGEAAWLLEDSGAGWAAPAEDSEALAELVLRMANTSEAERQAMGQAGRVYWERLFQRDGCLREIQGTLQQLLPSQVKFPEKGA